MGSILRSIPSYPIRIKQVEALVQLLPCNGARYGHLSNGSQDSVRVGLRGSSGFGQHSRLSALPLSRRVEGRNQYLRRGRDSDSGFLGFAAFCGSWGGSQRWGIWG